MGSEKMQKNITVDELKKLLIENIENTSSMQVYFILKVNDAFVLRLADIENEKTAPALKDIFLGYLQDKIIDNDEVTLKDLSVAEECPGRIYHYDYEEYPDALEIIKSFDIKRSKEEHHIFDFENDELRNLFGFLIYIGSMESGITLFKKHYPISLIKRDSFLLGTIKSKTRFEKLEGEDILRLNGEVQIFSTNHDIYILDTNVLEKFMGFTKMIYKSAEEALVEIEALDLIEDMEVLRDDIEDIKFARKLSRIQKTSPVFSMGITRDRIIHFTKNTKVLNGKFKYSDDGKSIRLDTKKSKLEFIKLLNDDYLISELTDKYYETNSKDSLT